MSGLLSKTEILNIINPKQLFGKTDPVAEYRRLASLWHPDKGGDAKVSAHINKLNDLRIKRADDAIIMLTDSQNKPHAFNCAVQHSFELGKVLLTDTNIAYAVNSSNEDLVDRQRNAIYRMKFKDKAMKDKYLQYCLPKIQKSFKCIEDDMHYTVIDKPNDVLRLSDVLSHFGGKLPERHVAWIVSRLLDLCCYLQYTGLSHNGINSENVFICPEFHTVSLLGGWFYAAPLGEKLVAAPRKTIEYAPSDLLSNKIGDTRTDLEMVKATARELLGDITSGLTVRNILRIKFFP